MGAQDERIDAYIAKSAEFAKPILSHLRKLVHRNCPDVSEAIKWGFPHFMYKGKSDRTPRILCSMAAFKSHCAFGFWNEEMRNSLGSQPKGSDAMGQHGRISSLSDLPGDSEMSRRIKTAMKLMDEGVKPKPRPKPAIKKDLVVPSYFTAALKKNKKALATFENFNYSNKKEYVDWVVEAKTEETRTRRLATAIEWMSEGKIRNWKYANR